MQTDHFPILNLNNSVAIGSKYVLHCPQFSMCWIIPIPSSTFSLWFDNAHKGSWHWVGLPSRLLIVLSLMFLPPPVTIYTLSSETFPCVHICVSTQGSQASCIHSVAHKSKYCKMASFFLFQTEIHGGDTMPYKPNSVTSVSYVHLPLMYQKRCILIERLDFSEWGSGLLAVFENQWG